VRGLLGLLEDLLQLWRAEVGDLRIVSQVVDVETTVRDTTDAYHAVAARAGHHLDLELPNNLPMVWTDVARVRQILGNLIINAIKYTATGGSIAVTAREALAEVASRKARGIAIEVRNSGPGIAPDKLDIIFEEFSRLQPDATPGAGLGLPISRRIARLLGGDVTVSSSAGMGSTFTLWLPLVRAGEEREGASGAVGESHQRAEFDARAQGSSLVRTATQPYRPDSVSREERPPHQS
jgi:signal transduction histidine kinase